MKRQIKLKGSNAQVIQGYMSGQSVPSLAELYGVAQASIYRLLKYNNVTLKPKGNLDGQEAAVIQNYLDGVRVDDICSQYQIGRSTVNDLLKQAGIPKRRRGDNYRKYDVNHSYFDVINTEQKAYFLGFLYADGFNGQDAGNVKLFLHPKDRKTVEAFQEAVGSNAPLYHRTGKSAACGVIINSRQLSARLAELGCMQAKTFKLTFPRWLDTALIHHFIRGYFDGDGHISSVEKARHKSIISILGTESFTATVAEILASECAVSTRIRKHQRSAGICYVNVRGNHQVKRVIRYLYKDATIYLERKKHRADGILNTDFHNPRRPRIYPRLTTKRARAIKADLRTGEADIIVADRYGVSKHVVYQIRTGRSWVGA